MAEPPFFRREAGRRIGDAGRASEGRLAKRVGARSTRASGAFVGDKGDMSLGSLLIEAKSTVSDALSLKLDWLAKIEAEALAASKLPAVAINFTDQAGRSRAAGWLLVREVDFLELLERLK